LPIRIYALAKQLKLDSKVLADICAKAGVTGKGSALASLTDEETAIVKDFVAGKRPGAPAGRATAAEASAASSTATPVMRREDYLGPGASMSGKVPVLVERPAVKKKSPAEVPPSAPPAEAEPLAAEEPVEVPMPEPVVEQPVIEEPVAEQIEKVEKVEKVERFERPIRPERILDKIPTLDRPSKSEKTERPERPERPERGPAIKLAPLPPSALQPPPQKPAEPAPQKPDIRLPLDAIRASKAGEKPLAEHLMKTEQKRRAAAKKGGPREPAAPEPSQGPPPPAVPGRERPRRGSGKGTPVEGAATEEEPTLGGREHRQLKRKRLAKSSQARRSDEEEGGVVTTRRPTRIKRTGSNNTAAPRKASLVVQLPCSVREFSEAIGIPVRTVLGKLLSMGVTSTNINAELSPEVAELLAVELAVEIEFRKPVSLEDKVHAELEREDDPAELQPRAPVVTFLGHVDHGKTSLLDRIIGINVVSSEKGGITQHIRAYRVEREGRAIAFVDTPGHEAFTEMRARGAQVTDIAVLVVAADDGVMPQTEEAISHARAAGVPIVVALNKIDLPGLNIDRIFQQLAANELLPSEWGGDVEVVRTSATTGVGIEDLLETLLTVAELHEYKANPHRPATGTCLEAELHEERGVTAKLMVQNGTLRVGDVLLCGPAYGRVKAMYDTLAPQQRYEEAGPSTPVNVTGLHMAPGAGDRFYVLEDISQARELAERRAASHRREELSGGRVHVTLENFRERLEHEEEVRTLNIILRADVRGSIEAIRKELGKLEHPEVQVKILQATVGGITEADVHLADASDAVIIGFNVVPDEGARSLADRRGVQIRRYDIIYQVTEDLKAALEGMLKPEQRVLELGRALVQRVYHISRVGSVAGCRVLAGTIQRDCRIRLIRDSRVIGEYPLGSLKREKDDAREVREGMECGMKLNGFDDVKEGDVLEAYKMEQVARTF
jgi:translation initiation factor IF-2